MASTNQLETILAELKAIRILLKSIPTIQNDIETIKEDIEIIKGCVSTENAKEFPAQVKSNAKGAKSVVHPMAASHK